jgi:hypothetical protein
MNATTIATLAAALSLYARTIENDARKAGAGTASFHTLNNEASRARHLLALIQHGSKLP